MVCGVPFAIPTRSIACRESTVSASSAWKTRNFTEEKQAFKDEFLGNTSGIRGAIQKFRAFVNVPGMEDE